MRIQARVLVVVVGLLAGCSLLKPDQPNPAEQAKLDHIAVLSAEPSRPHKVLGVVTVQSTVFDNCNANGVKRAALEQYPSVDAIVGFQALGAGTGAGAIGPTHCEATAVELDE